MIGLIAVCVVLMGVAAATPSTAADAGDSGPGSKPNELNNPIALVKNKGPPLVAGVEELNYTFRFESRPPGGGRLFLTSPGV